MPRGCALLALLVVALAGTTLAGCGRPDVRFCNTDRDCANGDICTGGSCAEGVPFRGGAAPIGGGVGEGEGEGEGDDVTPVDPCGAVVDDFDAGALAEDLWTPFADGGAEVGLAQGALVVALPAQEDFAWAGVAAGPLRFEGRSVTVALPEVPADAAAFAVVLVQAGSEDAYIVANGAALEMVVESAGAQQHVELAYDESRHGFVRLREALGDIVFETSSDGVTYSEAGRLAGPDLSAGAYLGLVAQAQGAVAPSVAAFSSVASPPILCD